MPTARQTIPITSHLGLPVMKLPFSQPAPWRVQIAPTIAISEPATISAFPTNSIVLRERWILASLSGLRESGGRDWPPGLSGIGRA